MCTIRSKSYAIVSYLFVPLRVLSVWGCQLSQSTVILTLNLTKVSSDSFSRASSRPGSVACLLAPLLVSASAGGHSTSAQGGDTMGQLVTPGAGSLQDR